MSESELPPAGGAVAEILASWIACLDASAVPEPVRRVIGDLLIDAAGLMVSARNEPYVQALVAASEPGSCTALGHGTGFDAASAALINGTAIHGEDFDDTFEGSPVHAGAPVLPAVLAACERFGLGGERALVGLAAGLEVTCRLTLVAPTAIHRAGFHPTAVLGAFGAAAGAGAALGLGPGQLVSALGIAGSMASGIIEYLAEGTWTKRLHPGWAAQSGLKAALMARHGFVGPRTVFEGAHGAFVAFAAPGIPRDFGRLTARLGEDWQTCNIAFKPYACGTMAQPFIDCAVALAAQGVRAEEVASIVCDVGEGTVHRLWEPLAEKHRPSTPYGAKFSVPFCIAAGLIDRAAGLGQFTEATIRDPRFLDLAGKVRYRIDPADEYPRNYTGHISATLRDGRVVDTRQPYLRGGIRAPLRRAELDAEFDHNVAFGGWPPDAARRVRDAMATLFGRPSLAALSALRQI